jgi:hypothetical protein
MLVKALAFTSVYFLEAGLFNGLQPIQIRFSLAFGHLTVVKCASAAPTFEGAAAKLSEMKRHPKMISTISFLSKKCRSPAFTVVGLFQLAPARGDPAETQEQKEGRTHPPELDESVPPTAAHHCPQSTLPHGSPLGDRSMKFWLEFRSFMLFNVVWLLGSSLKACLNLARAVLRSPRSIYE